MCGTQKVTRWASPCLFFRSTLPTISEPWCARHLFEVCAVDRAFRAEALAWFNSATRSERAHPYVFADCRCVRAVVFLTEFDLHFRDGSCQVIGSELGFSWPFDSARIVLLRAFGWGSCFANPTWLMPLTSLIRPCAAVHFLRRCLPHLHRLELTSRSAYWRYAPRLPLFTCPYRPLFITFSIFSIFPCLIGK